MILTFSQRSSWNSQSSTYFVDCQTARSSHCVESHHTIKSEWTLANTRERDTRMYSRWPCPVFITLTTRKHYNRHHDRHRVARLKVARVRTILPADFPRNSINETSKLLHVTRAFRYVALTFSFDEMRETIDERDDATAGRET